MRDLGDLSDLWYREYFLEVAREIQFPIDTSLPWVLGNWILDKRHSGGMETMLFLFDIYNDAGSRALHTLKRRFLFDEVEAEVCVSVYLLLSDHCSPVSTHTHTHTHS